MEIMSIKVIDEDDEIPLDKRPTPEELKSEYIERVKSFDQAYQKSDLKNDHNFLSPHAAIITDADTRN